MDTLLWYGCKGTYRYFFPSSQRVMADDIREIREMLERMQYAAKPHESVKEIRKNVISTPWKYKMKNKNIISKK